MDNSNNPNCCTSNKESNTNTDCCTPKDTSSNKNFNIKKKFGLGILGIALIFALTTAFKSSPETKTSCTPTTNVSTVSIADFEWIKTDKKVVYIVLNGKDVNQNLMITTKVEGIVNELNETDGSAHFFALEADNPNYRDVVSKLKIEETPSIVVLGKSASTINGTDANSTKLIRAYDAALSSKASCSPGEKASCVGKGKASCDPKAKTECSPKQKAACAGSKTSN